MGFWYIYTHIYYSFFQGTWWKVSFCKDNDSIFLSSHFCSASIFQSYCFTDVCSILFFMSLYTHVFLISTYYQTDGKWKWMPSLAESWRLFLQLLQKLEVLLFTHFWSGFQQQCSRIMKHTGSISWPADCFISSSVSFFKLL